MDPKDLHTSSADQAPSRPQFFVTQKAPQVIAQHTLTADETLSHLSLRYYGSATKPFWMVIYEANRETIGENPNHVHAGMQLNIPELPKELRG